MRVYFRVVGASCHPEMWGAPGLLQCRTLLVDFGIVEVSWPWHPLKRWTPWLFFGAVGVSWHLLDVSKGPLTSLLRAWGSKSYCGGLKNNQYHGLIFLISPTKVADTSHILLNATGNSFGLCTYLDPLVPGEEIILPAMREGQIVQAAVGGFHAQRLQILTEVIGHPQSP